jgi:hypothetical protein
MDTDDAIRFWTLPDGSRADDARPPVTDSQLAAFTQQFGVELPSDLVELYRQQNGGFSVRFESLFWPIAHGGNDDVTNLRTLCETYHDDEGMSRLWTSCMGDLANVFVFLGDGHFYFVLNYNDQKNGEPIVAYVDDNGVRTTGQTFAEWIVKSIGSG